MTNKSGHVDRSNSSNSHTLADTTTSTDDNDHDNGHLRTDEFGLAPIRRSSRPTFVLRQSFGSDRSGNSSLASAVHSPRSPRPFTALADLAEDDEPEPQLQEREMERERSGERSGGQRPGVSDAGVMGKGNSSSSSGGGGHHHHDPRDSRGRRSAQSANSSSSSVVVDAGSSLSPHHHHHHHHHHHDQSHQHERFRPAFDFDDEDVARDARLRSGSDADATTSWQPTPHFPRHHRYRSADAQPASAPHRTLQREHSIHAATAAPTTPPRQRPATAGTGVRQQRPKLSPPVSPRSAQRQRPKPSAILRDPKTGWARVRQRPKGAGMSSDV